MERVLLTLLKSEAISSWGVTFSSSLRGLNMIFKDLPNGAGALLDNWPISTQLSDIDIYWSDTLCGFLPNENKEINFISCSISDLTIHLGKTLYATFSFCANSSYTTLSHCSN